MTITLPRPSPRSVSSRAYGQATVLMRRGGGLTAAASALVTPYVAGTGTPYALPLYAGPDATTPLVFPVATGEDGVVELWSEEAVRLDVEAVHPTWGANRVTLDLEWAPDATPEVDAYTRAESDALFLTESEGDLRYQTLPLPPPLIPAEYLTETEADALFLTPAEGALAYAPLGHTHPPVATSAWVSFVIDGGGSAITTGQKGHFAVPAGEIEEVVLLADASGSIVLDLWKDTYTNYPPVVGDSICASAKPTLTGAVKAQDTTLTGWTTTVAEGDIIAVNVDSAATIVRCTLALRIVRS